MLDSLKGRHWAAELHALPGVGHARRQGRVGQAHLFGSQCQRPHQARAGQGTFNVGAGSQAGRGRELQAIGPHIGQALRQVDTAARRDLQRMRW